jgi:alkyldihydroxyacetonephosphate synthase
MSLPPLFFSFSFFFLLQFGHALKPPAASIFASMLDSIKTFYVTRVKGFDKDKLAVATLLFEGSQAEVDAQQKAV